MKISIGALINYGYIRFINQHKILNKIKNKKKIQYEDKIAIAISTNSNFIKQTKIMIKSLENSGCIVKLYILNINLKAEEISDLKKIAPSNVDIVPVLINGSILKKLKISDKWPIEAWARILIPELIDEEIVIYMDVDTIVVGELIPLINDINTKPIAGVASTFYFSSGLGSLVPKAINSGILILHKKELNDLNFSTDILKFAKSNPEKLKMPDQDSINIVCKKYMKNIKPCFNAMNYFYAHTFKTISKYTENGYYSKKDFNAALFSPVIIHFNGGPFARPWIKKGIKHPYYKIYQYYDRKVKL